MTATPPDDVAAMFDLPPLPAATPSTGSATAAAEAELAAELAAAIESGDIAADAPDSRTDLRVDVSWPARMQLPGGHVIELRVRNVSEGGVSLISDEHIPARAVVNFEMSVPPFDGSGGTTVVRGTIETTYTVVHDSKFVCGGTWQVAPPGLDLVHAWIRALRR